MPTGIEDFLISRELPSHNHPLPWTTSAGGTMAVSVDYSSSGSYTTVPQAWPTWGDYGTGTLTVFDEKDERIKLLESRVTALETILKNVDVIRLVEALAKEKNCT